MNIIFWSMIAYLYGAIPYAYLATYLIKGKRLSKEGTGNIGVTNAFKIGGTTAGLVTVLGEISKALVPIGIGRYFFAGMLPVTLLFVFLALVGTSFSIFLKGKGGKGSTAAWNSLLILSPYSFFILLLLWTAFFKLSKGNLVIKKIPLFLIPLVIFLVERDWAFTLFGLLAGLLLFLNNFRRKDDFAYYKIFQRKSGVEDADTVHS
ncbi:MAG: glycerol-3-phosphate acyltransferase [Proteobacteria bacterium]|nr:glycerol-3-phosphate acyltransferase [Pseudomonadota bacterium]